MPGVYFLNAGAEGIVEEKRSYIHRIFDAMVFRVLSEKELMPTGIVDFRIEPEMEKLNS
jgi:lipopolysaccharide transport system ATP-binding protein